MSLLKEYLLLFPFDGTGYITCACCNQKLCNESIIQEFCHSINASRYHHKPFGTDDDFETNSEFFSIMENFYMKDIDDIMIKATHYFKEHTEQLHSHKIKQYQF